MKRIIGRINPLDRHVTIWGAGFSGLILGYFLKRNGYKITIYERTDKAGGKIHTKQTDFGLVETAAHALYLNADGLELLKELKLDPMPAEKKLRRLLMIHGKPKRAFQLSVLAKMALNSRLKPPLISDGLTVAEFFRPLLGTEIVNQFLTPALGGVYAVPAESLHFKSIFDSAGRRTQFESYWEFIRLMIKEKKALPKIEISGTVSFEGGMQALINRLADSLKPDIKFNHQEPFRLKGNTVICTDAHNAGILTAELLPEISQELSRIRYQELSSVTVFLKREIRSLNRAFGVLMPMTSDFNSIGVINNKAIFPANNSNVFSYTLIGRKKMSEEEIFHDLKLLTPEFVPEDIEHLENSHWDKAIPIYDLQRYLSVKKLHQISSKHNNLAIFGNYVAGISLREMILAAKNFAQGQQE